MKLIRIYTEGTTWEFKTSDERFVDNLCKWLNKPKSKDFMQIDDKQNERIIFLRKQKVNMITIDEVT
jgi:hypothetical protein